MDTEFDGHPLVDLGVYRQEEGQMEESTFTTCGLSFLNNELRAKAITQNSFFSGLLG